jgi:hypothetical protein
MCSYLYEWEGTYRNYCYLCCHHLQKICALRKRGHLLFLKGQSGSGLLFACVGGVLGWSTGDVVASPVSFPPHSAVHHKVQIPKGIGPGLLNWAIRTRISWRFRPLLVSHTFLLLKVATLLSSHCPCCRCTTFRTVSS